MKRFLLLPVTMFFITSVSGQCFRFDGGTNSGFLFGQGVSVGAYDNPNLNGCGTGNFTDDFGLITPGVGGNNPGFIETPILTYAGNNFINFTFRLFVFNANLKCETNQPLPCVTMAKAYIVPTSYNSSTPPTGSNNIAESNLILAAAQGGK